MAAAVREGVQLATAKRDGIPKATDEAYFVRRLRAKAGNIVALGPLFCVQALIDVSSVCRHDGPKARL